LSSNLDQFTRTNDSAAPGSHTATANDQTKALARNSGQTIYRWAEFRSLKDEFKPRSAGWITHETVGGPESKPINCPGLWNAKTLMPQATEILNGGQWTSGDDFKRHILP
jgi:hypothetical protein